ncbi:MAG: hypothetical protein E4H40_04050, partial [Candidatus Brocadiia bacterium]
MDKNPNPIAKAIDGALERLEQKARETLSPADLRKKYRAMLVRLLSKMHSFGIQLNEQKNGTIMHGIVIALLEPLKAGQNGDLALGMPVTVIRSQELPEMIGKKGYVLTEPNEEGEAFIASTDGAVGYFVWNSDHEKSEVAVDLVPEPRVLVSVAGRLIDVPCPKDMELVSGDVVRITSQNHTILEKITLFSTGQIASVKRIMQNGRVFIKYGDTMRIVMAGQFHSQLTIGRQVIVDRDCTMVIEDLGDPETD